MHTVRWNDNTDRFEIVTLGPPDETGDRQITGIIYAFPPGTTNAEACTAYDHWRATGDLPE